VCTGTPIRQHYQQIVRLSWKGSQCKALHSGEGRTEHSLHRRAADQRADPLRVEVLPGGLHRRLPAHGRAVQIDCELTQHETQANCRLTPG
jgi:hypothetical protein